MSDETVGTRLTTLRCVHDDNGIPCAWCCETADLIDAAVADLVRERDIQQQAANHWFTEAQRDHNDNVRLQQLADGQLAAAEKSRENAGKWLTAYQGAFAEARALEAENVRLREALLVMIATANVVLAEYEGDPRHMTPIRHLMEARDLTHALVATPGEKEAGGGDL